MKMQSVHSFLTWPWAPLCLAAQVAWLAFAANAAPAQPVTTAIYLQHVGPADKPIFPIVVCETKPSDAELARVLGTGPAAQFVNVVTVSKRDLNRCLTEITGKLGAAKKAGDQRPLGTFKVTVTQARSERGRALPADTEHLVHVLVPEAMPAVFAVLEKTDAFSAPDAKLKNTLAALKARTGLKEAK